MSGHTKEPWAPGFYMGTEYPFNIVAPDGRVLATVRGEQDRHRIVACVNACAGIPTNALIAAGQSAVMALRPVDELVAENQRLIADLGTACQEVKTARRLSFFDQVVDLERQVERAYQQLEINGVPRERAKSVSNGIDVLVTRMRREIADLEQQRDELTTKHQVACDTIERQRADIDTIRGYLDEMKKSCERTAQQRDGLLTAAQAVIDRWDTPLWKDVPATAEFINELRAAVARVKP